MQLEFRAKRSCVHAISSVTGYMSQQLDLKKI